MDDLKSANDNLFKIARRYCMTNKTLRGELKRMTEDRDGLWKRVGELSRELEVANQELALLRPIAELSEQIRNERD